MLRFSKKDYKHSASGAPGEPDIYDVEPIREEAFKPWEKAGHGRRDVDEAN